MRQFLFGFFILLFISTFAQTKKRNILLNERYPFSDTSSLHITIDSLKVGSKYFINVESIGCFHHSNLYLTIYKNKDGYYATFKMNGEIEGKKVNSKFKKAKLTKYQIDSIRSFEKQLLTISAQTFSCTTEDIYSLTIGSTKNILNTDNCDWKGIGKLIGLIFKNEEKR